MNGFLILLLAVLPAAAGRKVGAPAPPAEESAPDEPGGLGLSTDLGSEMTGEFEKVQRSNLETAASASSDELAKTCLFADRILQDATAESPGARNLALKAHTWAEAYNGMNLLSAQQRDRFRRQGYRPANRAADLRKAQREAEAASARYGLRALPPSSESTAKALDAVVVELDALGASKFFHQLKREASILRAQLMLRAADRKMTGRTLD